MSIQPIDDDNDEEASSTDLHSLLAMVPRGLEDEIISIVKEKIPEVDISILGEGEISTHDRGLQVKEAFIRHQQKKKNKHHDGETTTNSWFATPTGTFHISPTQQISVGYREGEICTWSRPGILDGSVWMKFRIPSSRIPEFTRLRCIGPVMALVASTEDYHIKSLQRPDHDMEELLKDIGDWISSMGNEKYGQYHTSAMVLWKNYVSTVWKPLLSKDIFSALEDRIQQDRIRFRLSGMRDQEDATYPRQDFLKGLIDAFGMTVVPSYHGIGADNGWTVNLKQFDIEFVIICLSNGFMAIGISLLPYSLLDSTSFDKGGIPPDISKPYMGSSLMKDLVRLRPTTAHILLHIARIQPFEVVLDPCAGVGTIPLEADVFFDQCIGIGGDVVLNRPTMGSTAATLEQIARDSTRPVASSTLLAAWDASHIPVRDHSIDVCVSDLPFGKQCLSSNAVKQLFPLLFLECARVLTLNVGRMVLLCGSPSIIESLKESEKYWRQPCTVALPVNIGGLQACVIRIERNNTPYDSSDHGRRRDRVRKLTKKRDMVSRQQHNSGIETNTKKRCIKP